MLKLLLKKIPRRKCGSNHEILIVSPEITLESWLVQQLKGLNCKVQCFGSVDSFLDSNSFIAHPLILIDVDIFDPGSLDDIMKLRMYFGEGPSTKIISMSSLLPESFEQLLENAGCDINVKKSPDFSEVLSIVVTHLTPHM